MCDVLAGNFWRPRRESDWRLGRWSVSTLLAPACIFPGCLPDQHGSWRGCWGTLTWCSPQDSQHAEYFISFGIAPLESIYWRLLSMDYRDIWHSTKMLQGLFSRSCGLYTFYYLAMCSRGVPLGIITGSFQEYDFAYNEAQIRRLLRWHTHAYIQRRQLLIVIRPPEPTEDTPVYVISSKHGLVAHVSYWNWKSETVWGLPSENMIFHLFWGADCAPGKPNNILMAKIALSWYSVLINLG